MTAERAQRALHALAASGALRRVDQAFAECLQNALAADASVALAGALAMRAVSLGHSGFALTGADALLAALGAEVELPLADDWAAALRAAAPLVGTGAMASPAPSDASAAVLHFEHGRVALSRYARYEAILASRLCTMVADAVTDVVVDERDDAMITSELQRLFARDTQQALGQPIPDRQALAAAQALRRRLLLVTGGPGTGKTTTVARMLAILAQVARARGAPSLRIALTAPTGRAAVRLAEAIDGVLREDLAQGRIDAALTEAIPRQAATLHRLLGARPGRTGFRHHAQRPLPYDLIIVDEASMIDLPLMAKLVDAVPAHARLILLGDPDQLPAIEAGDVLGSLCEASGDGLALPHDDMKAVSRWLGTDVPVADMPVDAASATPTRPLVGCRVHLLHDWRQSEAVDLQMAAAAVRAGDRDGLFAHLRANPHTLHWQQGDHAALAAAMRAEALPAFAAVRDAPDPRTALMLARRLRILTALRHGPVGAEDWNAWCAAELGARELYFHGRLLMITANSEHHGLYNGDLGVVWHTNEVDAVHDDAHGHAMVWFEGPEGLRGWRPAQLPAHGSAYATTVHKAQGSEFEQVVLLLPERQARSVSRELLYTALTRARRRVLLWGDEAALNAALSRRTWRDSGLLARLQQRPC